jgi:hypothetical protein
VSKRIPDWVLERHLVGELPEGYRPEDLEQDPTVPARLAALRESDAKILDEAPPARIAAAVHRRASAERPGAMRWIPIAVAAGLVAIALPVFLARPPGADLQTKGLKPRLEVLRQKPGGYEQLDAGSVARAGDVVQLRIVAADARYGAVLSVDGTGAATQLYPVSGTTAAALPRDGALVLPEALELDAQGEFERFLLVTSVEAAFDLGPVLEAARALGPDPARALTLGPGLEVASVVVSKAR